MTPSLSPSGHLQLFLLSTRVQVGTMKPDMYHLYKGANRLGQRPASCECRHKYIISKGGKSNELSSEDEFHSSGALSYGEVPPCLETHPTTVRVGRLVLDSLCMWPVGSCEEPVCKSWQLHHRCGNSGTPQRIILQDCGCTF